MENFIITGFKKILFASETNQNQEIWGFPVKEDVESINLKSSSATKWLNWLNVKLFLNGYEYKGYLYNLASHRSFF